MTKQKDARVKCDNCGRSAFLSEVMITRSVPGIEQTVEVGIKCNRCGYYTRAYWDSVRLQTFRARLREAQDKIGESEAANRKAVIAKTRFNAEFDRVQSQVKEQLGDPDKSSDNHLSMGG